MLPLFPGAGQDSIQIALNRPKGLRKVVWTSAVSSLLEPPIKLNPTTVGRTLPVWPACCRKKVSFSEQTDWHLLSQARHGQSHKACGKFLLQRGTKAIRSYFHHGCQVRHMEVITTWRSAIATFQRTTHLVNAFGEPMCWKKISFQSFDTGSDILAVPVGVIARNILKTALYNRVHLVGGRSKYH